MARKLVATLAIILFISVISYAELPGLAGTAAASSGSLSVSPSAVKAGEKVVVKGAGFTPGSPVIVELITTYKKVKGAILTMREGSNQNEICLKTVIILISQVLSR